MLKKRRFLGLLAGVALLGWAMAGCGGGEDTGTTTGSASAGPRAGGREEDDDPAQVSPGGGGAGQMSTAMPPGTMGGAQPSAPAQAAAPKETARPSARRADPFAPWWDSTPPPPPVLTQIPMIRIATYRVEPPPEVPVEIIETPTRRVAGILSGQGVYALVEGPEGQTVVKPGDMLGDYRVESINATSISLKRKVGNRTYRQTVPLTDVGSSNVPRFGGGAPFPPGGPGPGFGGGLPGVGGGGGRAGEAED
jgi:translation initiation factor IF-2